MKKLAILIVLIWTHNSMAMGGIGSVSSANLSGIDLVKKTKTQTPAKKTSKSNRRKIASKKKRPQNIWNQETNSGWFN